MKSIHFTLIAIIIIFNLQLTTAQNLPTYQWGAQGCANHSSNGGQRQFLTVSPNGTVYSAISSGDMNDKIMAGVSSPNRFSGGRISAHDTRGNLKWTKFFGGYGTTGGIINTVADNQNNLIVYAVFSAVDSSLFGIGELKPAPYIHPDTILPYNKNNSQNRKYALIKFNNNGQLLWFRWLERNYGSGPYKNKISVNHIDVDNQNNILLYGTLDKDTFFNGQFINPNRIDFGRFTLDEQGNYLTHQAYDIHIGDRYNWALFTEISIIGDVAISTDTARRKTYLSISARNNGDTFMFGNHRFEFTSLLEPKAIWMQYDWNGQLDWLSYCDNIETTNMVKDELGYFYTTIHGAGIPLFNGNTTIPNHQRMFSIIRLDSIGGNLKHINSVYSETNSQLFSLSEIAYINNSVIFCGILWSDPNKNTYKDKDTAFIKNYEKNVPSSGIIQLDADNGKLINIVTLKRSNNTHEISTPSPMYQLHVDNYHNMYFAGLWSADTLYTNQNTLINHHNRLNKEGFWGKLAYNNMDCNLPDPDFTATLFAMNGLELTYTGGTPNLTHQKWSLGDGTKAYNQNVVNYRYSQAGTYRVCLDVQNDCGPKAICKFITVSEDGVGIPQVSTNNTAVYPNPSKGTVSVQSIQTINNIVVYDILGQQVYHQKVGGRSTEERIDLSTLPTGTYIIQISDTAEKTYIHKVVKQ